VKTHSVVGIYIVVYIVLLSIGYFISNALSFSSIPMVSTVICIFLGPLSFYILLGNLLGSVIGGLVFLIFLITVGNRMWSEQFSIKRASILLFLWCSMGVITLLASAGI
jgi:hypothetical protein